MLFLNIILTTTLLSTLIINSSGYVCRLKIPSFNKASFWEYLMPQESKCLRVSVLINENPGLAPERAGQRVCATHKLYGVHLDSEVSGSGIWPKCHKTPFQTMSWFALHERAMFRHNFELNLRYNHETLLDLCCQNASVLHSTSWTLQHTSRRRLGLRF